MYMESARQKCPARKGLNSKQVCWSRHGCSNPVAVKTWQTQTLGNEGTRATCMLTGCDTKNTITTASEPSLPCGAILRFQLVDHSETSGGLKIQEDLEKEHHYIVYQLMVLHVLQSVILQTG